MATVSIGDAATRLGVSADTIRRRIGKGTLTGHQEPTAQGFRWQVEIPEIQEKNGHQGDAHGDALENLLLVIKTQADELEARRREISELHVLLQTAQAALMAPKENRRWWQFW